jgi:hypothetical protein
MSTLNSFPDFDSLDCVTETYDSSGQYDTFDMNQANMSQLDTVASKSTIYIISVSTSTSTSTSSAITSAHFNPPPLTPHHLNPDNTDQSYQILLDQNISMETAYNQNPTLFDSAFASGDPSNIFSHSQQSDIMFGSDSKFNTDLKGQYGEALTGTTTGYETKDGNVPVAYVDTKYQ